MKISRAAVPDADALFAIYAKCFPDHFSPGRPADRDFVRDALAPDLVAYDAGGATYLFSLIYHEPSGAYMLFDVCKHGDRERELERAADGDRRPGFKDVFEHHLRTDETLRGNACVYLTTETEKVAGLYGSIGFELIPKSAVSRELSAELNAQNSRFVMRLDAARVAEIRLGKSGRVTATATLATATPATANRATATLATANRATANPATANPATANRATAPRDLADLAYAAGAGLVCLVATALLSSAGIV